MEKSDYLKELDNLVGLEFIPCESSNIAGYAYDSVNHKLWIAFRNERIYCYNKVSHDIADGLHLAESKGKYHAQHIKNHYDYEGYEID